MAVFIPAGLAILVAILMAIYGLFTIIEPLKIVTALVVGLWIYITMPKYTQSANAQILVSLIGGIIAYNMLIGMMWVIPLAILVALAPKIVSNLDMLMSLTKGKKRKR